MVSAKLQADEMQAVIDVYHALYTGAEFLNVSGRSMRQARRMRAQYRRQLAQRARHVGDGRLDAAHQAADELAAARRATPAAALHSDDHLVRACDCSIDCSID